MLFQKAKRSGASLPVAIAAIGICLASGCQMVDSANGDASAIATLVASLGDFAVSFARNLLAAWLF